MGLGSFAASSLASLAFLVRLVVVACPVEHLAFVAVVASFSAVVACSDPFDSCLGASAVVAGSFLGCPYSDPFGCCIHPFVGVGLSDSLVCFSDACFCHLGSFAG